MSVEGDVYVGSRALPTLLNVTLNTIEVFSFFVFLFLLFFGSEIGFWCRVLRETERYIVGLFCNYD